MTQHRENGHDDAALGQNNILLRQLRFALVLCGDDQLARRLVDRLAMIDGEEPVQSISSSATEFFQLKKLYELWKNEAQKTPAIPGMFQVGRENEAIQQGLDPSIAKILGGLPSVHRALLLLVCGEGFSYTATAQLLNITIEELMMALAAARRNFAGLENNVAIGSMPGAPVYNEVVHDAAQ